MRNKGSHRKGKPKISENIHKLLSLVQDEGFDQVEVPIANKQLKAVKRISRTVTIDCYQSGNTQINEPN